MATVIQLTKYQPAPLNPKRWREAEALKIARVCDRRLGSGTATEARINEIARIFLPVLMTVKRNPERKQKRKVRRG